MPSVLLKMDGFLKKDKKQRSVIGRFVQFLDKDFQVKPYALNRVASFRFLHTRKLGRGSPVDSDSSAKNFPLFSSDDLERVLWADRIEAYVFAKDM
jgi:hypothetical protein